MPVPMVWISSCIPGGQKPLPIPIPASHLKTGRGLQGISPICSFFPLFPELKGKREHASTHPSPFVLLCGVWLTYSLSFHYTFESKWFRPHLLEVDQCRLDFLKYRTPQSNSISSREEKPREAWKSVTQPTECTFTERLWPAKYQENPNCIPKNTEYMWVTWASQERPLCLT